MIDSLKFKDSKGNWFKVAVDYDNDCYDTVDDFTDEKKLQKHVVDAINSNKASFYWLALYKGNVDTFEFDEVDSLGGIFADYNQQGKENLTTILKDMLDENDVDKSIIDDIDIDEYGILSLKSLEKNKIVNN